MDIGLITMLLFVSLMLCLMTGFPIAFALGSIALLFTWFLWGPHALGITVSVIFGKCMSSFILIAIPLFILMGATIQESGIAERLFRIVHLWMGHLGGGLAVAAVVACTIFAAMTGIGGAGTVTMGLIALPAMLSYHYDKRLAAGSIVAGGALGILIPPSIIMIIYGMITGVSIGKLYAGGLFPGLVLSSLFVGYVLLLCKLKPLAGPPLEEKITWRKKFLATRDLIPVIILISAVLGTIFGGVCTPTEGAAIGAAGSLVCAALLHRLNWTNLKRASYTTLKLTAMVMWIVFGAYSFATIYIALGAPDLILELVLATHLGYWGIFVVVQIMYFILGMLLDPGAIVMITAPITMPIVLAMGYDPVWFGVIFTMNMQMAFITPPFGYNLFYLKGVTTEEMAMTMKDIYLAIIPFVLLQAIGLVIVAIFPQIALWLPNLILGGG